MCWRGHGGSALAAATAAAALLLGPALGHGESSNTVLAKTLVRALSYDTRLRERAGEQVVVAVVHKPGSAASEREGKEIGAVFRDLEAVTLHGLPLRVVSLGYGDAHDLEVYAIDRGIDAFFICQGLEDDLPRIKLVAHRHKIRTLGAREELAQQGVALVVELRDRDRPLIVVNLKESREEGAAFATALLRLAKVLK
jgi:hypothetical protein